MPATAISVSRASGPKRRRPRAQQQRIRRSSTARPPATQTSPRVDAAGAAAPASHRAAGCAARRPAPAPRRASARGRALVQPQRRRQRDQHRRGRIQQADVDRAGASARRCRRTRRTPTCRARPAPATASTRRRIASRLSRSSTRAERAEHQRSHDPAPERQRVRCDHAGRPARDEVVHAPQRGRDEHQHVRELPRVRKGLASFRTTCAGA